MTDINQQIEQEVQRRLGQQLRRSHEEITELRDIVREQTNTIVNQHSSLRRLLGEPLAFGMLLKVHNEVDIRCFKTNDEVTVVDPESIYYQQGGHIISGLDGSPVVDEEGYCLVRLHNETEVRLAVGVSGKAAAQIRLTQKDDGTFAVVSVDGKPWEVKGIPDLNLKVGHPVKVHPKTMAIVSKAYDLKAGPICKVMAVTERAWKFRKRVNGPWFTTLKAFSWKRATGWCAITRCSVSQRSCPVRTTSDSA
jgi:hypothetical protein